MLIVLPLFAFGALFLIFYANEDQANPQGGWRKAFLQAGLACGVWTGLSSEALSLIDGLSQTGVALAWGGLLAGIVGFGAWKGNLRRGWKGLLLSGPALSKYARLEISGVEWIFSGILVLILGTLFYVAVAVPPNNTDSLIYHMARVMHWAQNASLEHYPTAFEPQLYNPIWAEEAILHLRVLWGNDRVANLVQWASLIGTLVGVSGLAQVLGATRKGQLAAAAFAASLPMALLQSTSTQNDLVTGFWLVCLAYFTTLAARGEFSKPDWLFLAASLGLGMLTKGTFYPYAVPFGVWFCLAYLVRKKPARWLALAALLAAVVALLNAGYWARNIQTYGGPLGPSSWIDSRAAEKYGPAELAAGLVRNSVLHFTTPSESVNRRILLWVQSILNLLKQNPSYRMAWGWNHEDIAGAPLSLTLLVISAIALAFDRRRGRLSLPYAITCLGCFAMLSLIVNFEVYGIRYQVPFFLVSAPIVGLFLERLPGKQTAAISAILLLLTALPYLLFNRSKPLIALRDNQDPYTLPCLRGLGCTSVGSILNEPGEAIILANWTNLRDSYQAATEVVRASGCRDVGLRIDSSDKEYVFWWMLGAPQNGMRLESMNFDPNLERYADPDFKPCAIICTVCGDRTRANGLDLSAGFDLVQVYLGDGYTSELDSK